MYNKSGTDEENVEIGWGKGKRSCFVNLPLGCKFY